MISATKVKYSGQAANLEKLKIGKYESEITKLPNHCCPVKIIDSIENTYWVGVFEIFHPVGVLYLQALFFL
jgi:hypothetical protein